MHDPAAGSGVGWLAAGHNRAVPTLRDTPAALAPRGTRRTGARLRRRRVRLAIAMGAVLAAWNNLVHLPPAMDGWPYVPANLLLAAALVALARRARLGWDALGVDRRHLRRSALLGAAWVAIVAAGLAVALAVPALRPLLEDARFADRTGLDFARHALWRVPFGTAVLEEVAFRGAFLALLLSVTSTRRAVALSSAVFGLWHVRPAWSMVVENGGAADAAGVGALAGSVAITGLAGVALCWLRLRGGNLAAPFVAHAGMNSLATLAAGAAFALR